jgi:hypothetical protein
VDFHQDQVRLKLPGSFDGRLARLGFANQFEIPESRKDARRRAPKAGLVVNDEHLHNRGASCPARRHWLDPAQGDKQADKEPERDERHTQPGAAADAEHLT